MDHYPTRNPNPEQVTANMLLEFHIIKKSKDIPERTDVLAHSEWKAFKSEFSSDQTDIFSYFDNSEEFMTMINEKALWKNWMQLIGLGEHIPASLTNADASAMKFPVIMKISRRYGKVAHGGLGVYVVQDAEQLAQMKAQTLAAGHTYLIEESLTGMGLAEMTSFGSAFRGEVLSLRCHQRAFNPELLVHARHNANFSVQGDAPAKPFVKGYKLEMDEDYLVPCGQDVVNVVRAMFKQSKYTGPFCNDWKLDSNLAPKMMETNARMCGTLHLPQGDGLLLATFVPLAKAALDAISSEAYRNRSALLHSSKHVATYQRILEHERAALATGGGRGKDGSFAQVRKFDMNLRLPPLVEAYEIKLTKEGRL